MAGFLDTLIHFGERLAGAAEPSAKSVKDLGDAAGRMTAPLARMTALLEQTASALTDLLTHLKAPQTTEAIPEVLPAGGAAGEAAGAAGEVGAGAGAMALAGLGGAVTAIQGLAGAVEHVISMLGQWVEALDPGLMKQFGLVIRDLQATLGHAFTGVFEQLMPVVEQVAGIIMPLMEELKPVIDELANNAIANLIPEVELLASVFEALLPIFEATTAIQEALQSVLRPVILIFRMLFEELGAAFKILMIVFQPFFDALKVFEAVMDGLAEVIDVVITVYKTMAQTLQDFLKGIFGTDIQGTIRKIKDVIHEVIKAYLLFIAQLAKFFGADKFLHNLVENLKPKHGEMATGSTSIKTIESISKDMALAAAQAAGGSGDKKAGLEDVIAAMERIASGEDGINGELLETLRKIRDFLEKLGVTPQNVKDAATRTGWAALDPTGMGRRLFNP